MKTYGVTDRGLVRDSNQDAFCFDTRGEYGWAAVCDGMGGPGGGDVASRILSERFRAAMEDFDWRTLSAATATRACEAAIGSAHVLIGDYAAEHEDLRGMGTTIVAALAGKGTAYLVHVGDSRAYLFKNGRLTRVTRDHSVVQSLIESGTITEADARTHRQKNIITRAVGTGKTAEPEFDEVPFSAGDILLLCSDGLTNFVTEDEIATMLTENPASAPQLLVTAALAAGGGDNVTAVILAEEKGE